MSRKTVTYFNIKTVIGTETQEVERSVVVSPLKAISIVVGWCF